MTAGTVAPPLERRDRRLWRGGAAILAGEVTVRLSGLVSAVVVSRLLGPSVLGVVTVATAMLAYGSVFSDAGLSTLAQRRILTRPSSAGRVAAAVMAVQLSVAVVVSGVLVGAVPLLGAPHGTGRLVVAGVPVLAMQALSTDYVLQAFERMAWFSAVRTVTQLTGTALGLVLVILTRDAVWLLVAAWWGTALASLLSLAVLRRQGFRLVSPRAADVRSVTREGAPYLANSVVVQLLTNLDVVVVGALVSTRRIGEYGAAYRLAYTALVAAGVVVAASFPRLIVQWDEDRDRFAALVRKLAVLSARVTFPATALVLVDATGIVQLLFGRAFDGAGVLLAVMFAWVPLGWLNTITGQALMAAGRTSSHLRGAAVSACLLGAMLAVLVPWVGAVGAAASVAVAELCTTVLFGVSASRSLGLHLVRPWSAQWPWLVAPGAVLFAVRLLLPVVPSVLVGVVAAGLVVCVLELRAPTPTLRLLLGVRERTAP